MEKTIGESTDADWDLVVDINCRGVFNMSRAILPVMQEHGGSIVNIGSISATSPTPQWGYIMHPRRLCMG